MDTTFWRTRGVWLGNDVVDIFGLSVSFQFEGYTDYSFYYVHWGHNMLRGVLPYDPDFGYIVLNGYTNENGAYMFPPFYAYLYAIGIALPFDNWGIGLLIAAFGYITVFPVYGIARELSSNRHIGEVAALTYLFSPLTLYYTLFIWLNPAPFIFFFFSGFYALLKGHRDAGAILIVCAALFKQTAWFLGIPLVVYLLVRPQKAAVLGDQEMDQMDLEKSEAKRSGSLSFLLDYFDIKGFMTSTFLVVGFVLAVFLPYIIATPWFMNNLSLAAGGFQLDSFTELPGYGSPIRFQVLPVAAGLPELAQFLDLVVYYGFLLTFGVMVLFGLMLLEKRPDDKPIYYMRRLLFLTMLLMLWVHLMGPRGVYKYYFALFAPFFSIFSSAKMATSMDDKISFSYSMILLPALLGFAVILPNRSIYLFAVLLIFISYGIIEQIGAFWSICTAPLRWSKSMIKRRFASIGHRLVELREDKGPYQELSFYIGKDRLSIRYVGGLDQLLQREKTLRSTLFLNGVIISEKSSRIWDGTDDLSLVSHHCILPDGESIVIDHLSSIFLRVRIRKNGDDITP